MNLEKPLSSDSNILREFLKDREFADVTIKTGKKSMKAHKVLLVGASSVFKNQLKRVKNSVLQLKEIEWGIVEKIITFIYDNEIQDVEHHVEPLLEAATLVRS